MRCRHPIVYHQQLRPLFPMMKSFTIFGTGKSLILSTKQPWLKRTQFRQIEYMFFFFFFTKKRKRKKRKPVFWEGCHACMKHAWWNQVDTYAPDDKKP